MQNHNTLYFQRLRPCKQPPSLTKLCGGGEHREPHFLGLLTGPREGREGGTGPRPCRAGLPFRAAPAPGLMQGCGHPPHRDHIHGLCLAFLACPRLTAASSAGAPHLCLHPCCPPHPSSSAWKVTSSTLRGHLPTHLCLPRETSLPLGLGEGPPSSLPLPQRRWHGGTPLPNPSRELLVGSNWHMAAFHGVCRMND